MILLKKLSNAGGASADGQGTPLETPIEDLVPGRDAGGREEWPGVSMGQEGHALPQPKDQRYANAYVFGAVCPARDTGAALVLPFADTAAMQRHLNEISHASPPAHTPADPRQGRLAHDAQAARAGQHQSFALPPASPELNPTENIWQYLRQTYLSNRVFEDHEAVVEASSSAWNRLSPTPVALHRSPHEVGQLRLRPVTLGITRRRAGGTRERSVDSVSR